MPIAIYNHIVCEVIIIVSESFNKCFLPIKGIRNKNEKHS